MSENSIRSGNARNQVANLVLFTSLRPSILIAMTCQCWSRVGKFRVSPHMFVKFIHMLALLLDLSFEILKSTTR